MLLPLLFPLLLAWAVPAGAATDGECTTWVGAESIGEIERDGLDEVSGVAAGRASAGLFWLQSDAGSAAVYAILDDGTDLGRVGVEGASNEDWEDLALGPCGDDDCACLFALEPPGRDGVGVVWRFPEPASSDVEVGPAAAMRFRFADGAHDTEALVVHPLTGEVVVLTKGERTGVHVFPAIPAVAGASAVTLDHLGDLDLGALGASDSALTAADASPAGRRVALRTDEDLLLVDVPEGSALGAALADLSPANLPERLPAPIAPGGESVAFALEGDRLLLVGEGAGAPVWQVACGDFAASDEDVADRLGPCEEEKPKDGCGCAAGLGPGWELGIVGGLAALGRSRGRKGRRRP